MLLDYARGGNPPYHVARILRDYLVRADPPRTTCCSAGPSSSSRGPASRSYFLIERYRPLADAAALARR